MSDTGGPGARGWVRSGPRRFSAPGCPPPAPCPAPKRLQDNSKKKGSRAPPGHGLRRSGRGPGCALEKRAQPRARARAAEVRSARRRRAEAVGARGRPALRVKQIFVARAPHALQVRAVTCSWERSCRLPPKARAGLACAAPRAPAGALDAVCPKKLIGRAAGSGRREAGPKK